MDSDRHYTYVQSLKNAQKMDSGVHFTHVQRIMSTEIAMWF
jgi:hypothetical protein